jgi:hypothetical protein
MGPELHQDLSGQQETVLLLDVCNLYTTGFELHLDLPAKRSLSGFCSGCVYTIGPELHLDVFRLQEPVLLLMDLSRLYRGICCTWKCQQSWGLNCIWTYLDNRSFCWSGHIYSLHGTIAA